VSSPVAHFVSRLTRLPRPAEQFLSLPSSGSSPTDASSLRLGVRPSPGSAHADRFLKLCEAFR